MPRQAPDGQGDHITSSNGVFLPADGLPGGLVPGLTMGLVGALPWLRVSRRLLVKVTFHAISGLGLGSGLELGLGLGLGLGPTRSTKAFVHLVVLIPISKFLNLGAVTSRYNLGPASRVDM